METNPDKVPLQVIKYLHGFPFLMRLDIEHYGSHVCACYNQLNEKGEAIHMFNYGRGQTEDEAKLDLWNKVKGKVQDANETTGIGNHHPQTEGGSIIDRDANQDSEARDV